MATIAPVREIVTFDPTVEPEPVESQLAPRLASLEGRSVGLLANGKRNSMMLLEELVKLMQAKFGVREAVHATKPNVTRPAPPEIMEQLCHQSDFVLTAIGD